MKNIIVLSSLILATTAIFFFGTAIVLADSSAVVTEHCETTYSGPYGQNRNVTCTAKETGFVSNEVVVASVAVFAVGAGGLVVSNIIKSRLDLN